jgi:predicted acyltransferase
MYWFPFVHWTPEHTLAFNPVENTRIMGVLQRIALGYFFAALLIRNLKTATLVRVAVIMLLLYWLLLLLFAQGSDPYDMLGNAGSVVDRWLFGSGHLYHGEGVAFDPEGLLSTLPSIVNVIGGYLAGKWIQQQGKSYEGLAKLLLAGILLVLLALSWDWFFPINKKLWTSSYVLLTVGIDCILLGGLIYIVDFLQLVRWTNFFQVFGKNPLFIYLLSEIGATLLWFTPVGEKHQALYSWLYQHVFEPTGAYLGSFLFAVSFMLCCWLVGYVLDKKKIYVRV